MAGISLRPGILMRARLWRRGREAGDKFAAIRIVPSSNVAGRELLFADVFVPDFWMLDDVALQQLAAFAVVEIDHFNAVLPQPVQAPGKRTALAHNHRAE